MSARPAVTLAPGCDPTRTYLYVNGNRVSIASFLKMDAILATTVDASGCTGLTTLGDLPAATWVDASGCTGLTTLGDLPAATTVVASGCTGLTTLGDLPAATWVYANGCTGLTTLGDLPAATTVVASGCTGLTTLGDLPAATRVYASGCTGLTDAVFAGADSRGYDFIGLRLRGTWGLFAGCRQNWTLDQAERHWRNQPECLALARKVFALIAEREAMDAGVGQ